MVLIGKGHLGIFDSPGRASSCAGLLTLATEL
jgi:hypothetical protein